VLLRGDPPRPSEFERELTPPSVVDARPQQCLLGSTALDPIHEGNLLQVVKELRWLVGCLLAKSGLDENRIVQAFALAEAETKKLDEAMMDFAVKRFQETPEGKEACRVADEEWQKRQHAAWREWCVEDGTITRHPSVE
jgi:hypothetical protein